MQQRNMNVVILSLEEYHSREDKSGKDLSHALFMADLIIDKDTEQVIKSRYF